MANPNIGKTQGNSNVNWTKFKAGLNIKQLQTEAERSIFNMLNSDGNSVLSNQEAMGVVMGKVKDSNGKLVDKQFVKIKDLEGGRCLVMGEDGKQHVLSKDGKLLSDNVGFVAEFTRERRYKTSANSFEALAWALYKGEGVTNPSKEQIKARTEQLKMLNPNLNDGQLKGQNVRVLTTPERMAELSRTNYSKHKNEADGIAKEFYNISYDNNGTKSIEEMQNLVDSKFSAENIEAILDQYDKHKQGDSSIIDTVLSEWGAALTPKGQNAQKKVLRSLMNYLSDAAVNAGVSKAEIDKYKNDFEKALAPIGYDPKPSPERLEKALDGLRGAINTKRSGAKSISTKEAMSEMQNVAGQEQTSAATQYNEARAAEKGSWSAKIGDWGLGYFVGKPTNADMAAKVKEHADFVEALQNAKTEEEFKDIFQNGGFNKDGLRFSGTGVPFDENKMAARKELINKYEYATSMNTTIAAALDCKMALSYEELRAKVKQDFQMDDATVDNIILSYSPVLGKVSFTNEEKEQYLRKFVEDTMNNAGKELNAVTGGKTIEQLAKDAELATRSAFGNQNIVQEVTNHNERERVASMVTQAGAEIAGTIAMQFIPGLGQAAASRLATSAAKWGAKSVKVAKYAQKAEKAFATVKNVQTGAKAVKGAKTTTKILAKGGQMAYQMGTTAAATFAIDMSDGKSVKESLEKALMNASFAGVGVTSNMLAPKFAQAFGISNEVATQFAEEVINAMGSAGVVSLQGGEYGSKDALIDMITGMAIARFAGGAGHGVKGAADAATSHTKINADATLTTPKVETNVTTPKANAEASAKPSVDAPAPKPDVDAMEYTVTRPADFENGDRLVDYVKHEQNGIEYEIPYVEYADGTYGLDASKIRTADGNGGYRIATKEDFPEGLLLDQETYQWFVANKDPMVAAGFFSDLFTTKPKASQRDVVKLVNKGMEDPSVHVIGNGRKVRSNKVGQALDGNITQIKELDGISPSEITKYTQEGEVCSIGEKLFVSCDGKAIELKVSKKTFERLFPPNGFAMIEQKGSNNCWLVSSLNSMTDSSYGRAQLYSMLEETASGDILVHLKSNRGGVIKFPGGNPVKSKFTQLGDGASPGIEMIHQAVLTRNIGGAGKSADNIANVDISTLENVAGALEHSDINASMYLHGTYSRSINNPAEIKSVLENFDSKRDMATATWEVHARSIVGYDPETQMITYHDPYAGGVDVECNIDEFLAKYPYVVVQKAPKTETNITSKNVHTGETAPKVSTNTANTKTTELVPMQGRAVIAETVDGIPIIASASNKNVSIQLQGKASYTNVPIPAYGKYVEVPNVAEGVTIRIENNNGKITVTATETAKTAAEQHVSSVSPSVSRTSLPIPEGYREIGVINYGGKECVQIKNSFGRVLTEIDGRWQLLL